MGALQPEAGGIFTWIALNSVAVVCFYSQSDSPHDWLYKVICACREASLNNQGRQANPGSRALARFAASNPAGGIDVYPLWVLYIVR